MGDLRSHKVNSTIVAENCFPDYNFHLLNETIMQFSNALTSGNSFFLAATSF